MLGRRGTCGVRQDRIFWCSGRRRSYPSWRPIAGVERRYHIAGPWHWPARDGDSCECRRFSGLQCEVAVPCRQGIPVETTKTLQNAHESRQADQWPITISSTQGWAPEEQSADGRFVNRKHEQEGSSDNVSKASFPASKYPSAKDGGGAKEAWNFRGIEDEGPDIAELHASCTCMHAGVGRQTNGQSGEAQRSVGRQGSRARKVAFLY